MIFLWKFPIVIYLFNWSDEIAHQLLKKKSCPISLLNSIVVINRAFYSCNSRFEILREIRSWRSAICAILGAMNFANLANFSFQKLQKCIRIKIQSLNVFKWQILRLWISTLWFHVKSEWQKIVKFLHCDTVRFDGGTNERSGYRFY